VLLGLTALSLLASIRGAIAVVVAMYFIRRRTAP